MHASPVVNDSVRISEARVRGELRPMVRLATPRRRRPGRADGDVMFVIVPTPLARMFTPDPRVIVVAVMLIPIAGIFQVFDGIQAVAAGILRGIGDTRAPLIVNLFGFWLLGVPVSIYLGFYTSAGAAGLWWGLVVGLGAVAVFLLLRIRVRMRRGLVRVE